MGTRKEYRPFDAELAKAGAPYGALYTNEEIAIDFYGDGYVTGRLRYKGDERWTPMSAEVGGAYLVMLPIAHCQSKPVYVGDTLYDANGERFEVEVGHTASMLKECSWDKPHRVETRMSAEELSNSCRKSETPYQEWRMVANAAIARAISDGDVAPRKALWEVAERVVNKCLAGDYRPNVDDVDTSLIIDQILKEYK